MNEKRRQAFRIGTLCIVTYLASYITKNILSVSTPEMIKETFFSKEYIGLLSSICFIFYAIGQFINGFIGDNTHPKYMVIIGLGISSVSTFSVPLTYNRFIHFAAFALIGFGLSMLRGPLMKTISENTAPAYARIICTFFSVTSFVGPLIAGFLSIIFNWRIVFLTTGIISIFIAITFFIVISGLEKKGKIVFTKSKSIGIGGNVLSVFKLKDFIYYMFISSIGEIVASSITFWIPTYTTEHLGFSGVAASAVYSIVSVTTAFVPFIALIIYEKLIRNSIKLALTMYIIAFVFFIAVRFTEAPILNIIFLIIAKMSAASASSIVWSTYIPGLARSGRVSSANGVIDASGYLAASLANVVFSKSVAHLGWNGIVSMWYIIMLIGAFASITKLYITKRKSADYNT